MEVWSYTAAVTWVLSSKGQIELSEYLEDKLHWSIVAPVSIWAQFEADALHAIFFPTHQQPQFGVMRNRRVVLPSKTT